MQKNIIIDFASAVSQFEKAIKEFQIRKVIYQTVFRGRGLEFDGYRNIEPEEDAGMIDWKASLRTNRLLAKQYVEERNLNIYFVLDASNNMLFGSSKKLKAEYASEIIVALSRLVINSNDNPGLIMFSDRVIEYVGPGKSNQQFPLIIKTLSSLENYGGRFDFEKCADYLLKIVDPKNSVVILVSDFINLKNKSEKKLKLLASRFETISFMVRDPLDEGLPKASYQILLQDPNSQRQILVDSGFVAEKYNETVQKQKSFVREMFKQANLDLLELNSDKSFVIPVVSFLKLRAAGGH